MRFTDTPDHAGWINKCRKLYTTPPAPIALEAIENAIEYIRSIAFHIDEDDYHGKHIAYFMRQALAWLEGHSCSDDRLGKAENQTVHGNQAAESNRGNEWTGNPDIDNAIIMLDRIDTLENCDDDRIEAVKAVLRRLAGNYPVTPGRLPGGFTIEDAKELHENLVRSHISQALSGEKMKKKDRDADLRWIHGVIVQAAWFVKASLEQTALSGTPPVTTDGWISCSERMPDTKTAVLVAREFDRKGDWRMKWATYIPGHPDANDGWIIPGASWKPSHWMPLPEPPQEVNRG